MSAPWTGGLKTAGLFLCPFADDLFVQNAELENFLLHFVTPRGWQNVGAILRAFRDVLKTCTLWADNHMVKTSILR